MPQNPRPGPLVYVEIEVSYRWHDHEPQCAYVTVIEQRGNVHRRIVDTRHLIGSPERLVDDVHELVRLWTLEYVLAPSSPF